MSWTNEQIEHLKQLWAEGLSASQIAAELGGDVSRNAVLGKLHRLGLVRNETKLPNPSRARKPSPSPEPPLTGEPSSQVDRPPAPVASHEPPAAPAAELPRREAVTPRSEGVTIMELREAMCRWPLGDPSTPDFRYCGVQAAPGLPYCPHHAQIAYQPAAERKRLRA